LKFVLFVEGYSEKMSLPAFLKRWLDNRLRQPVGMKIVRFEGWADYNRDVQKKARVHLNAPGSDDVVAVIGLIDLYGPTIFPAHLANADDRYNWGKGEFENRVAHERFRHFFAVHETEAWLLSEPALFHHDIRGSFPGRIAEPETVNFTEPPAKMLERLYKNRLKQTYKKVTHGKELFDKLDPATAYDKCPRLRELLDEMLRLAIRALA
jgi:uncharacterized protein DUF4276